MEDSVRTIPKVPSSASHVAVQVSTGQTLPHITTTNSEQNTNINTGVSRLLRKGDT